MIIIHVVCVCIPHALLIIIIIMIIFSEYYCQQMAGVARIECNCTWICGMQHGWCSCTEERHLEVHAHMAPQSFATRKTDETTIYSRIINWNWPKTTVTAAIRMGEEKFASCLCHCSRDVWLTAKWNGMALYVWSCDVCVCVCVQLVPRTCILLTINRENRILVIQRWLECAVALDRTYT